MKNSREGTYFESRCRPTATKSIIIHFSWIYLLISIKLNHLFSVLTLCNIMGGWHVSLFSPLPLVLCYYQFISLCLEDSEYIHLLWELYMHTTLLRNCVWLYLWRHIFENTCLRKKIQGLFYFKIKIDLFCWIITEKRFLKNSNEFFHFLWRLRLEDNFARFPSFYYIYLYHILY